jgi:hypothetical protein
MVPDPAAKLDQTSPSRPAMLSSSTARADPGVRSFFHGGVMRTQSWTPNVIQSEFESLLSVYKSVCVVFRLGKGCVID